MHRRRRRHYATTENESKQTGKQTNERTSEEAVQNFWNRFPFVFSYLNA